VTALSYKAMDTIAVYALMIGSIWTIFLFINLLPYLTQIRERICLLAAFHLTYPYLIHRHRFLGPWNRANCLLQVLYLATNVLCLGFQASSIYESGSRAGTLALLNILPSFIGPNLSFSADIFGISLRTYQKLHYLTGITSVLLICFHILIAFFHHDSFSFSVWKDRYGFVVCVSTKAMIMTN
jgi:hypothetical protein